jgi:Superinfection immunity protein
MIRFTILAVAAALLPGAALAGTNDGNGVFSFLVLGLMLAFYFLPAIVALIREHHQMLAIFLLNLLLGWTALFWILALVWAATATHGKAAQHAALS